MRINTIEIQNFKGFELESFSFSPQMTVLIGDNGAGKTSILDALSFALGTFFIGVDGVPTRALKSDEKRLVVVSPDSFEVKVPLRIKVNHTLNERDYEWCRQTNKVAGTSTSFKQASELIDSAEIMIGKVRSGETVELPLFSYYGTDRLSNEKLSKLAYAKQGSRLEGYQGALDPKSSRLKSFAWFKTFEDSILKFDKDKALYHAFANAITNMVPQWQNVRFSWAADDMLGQLDDGQWMAYGMLSSGYQGIVRLAADIAYRAIKLNPHLGENAVKKIRGVVLIDELDMHLHPKWQKTIVADLKRTFPRIQFIVTSHSPFIIQSLQSDEVVNMNGEVSDNPSLKGIEDIAEDEMQIEHVRRSRQFLAMQDLAAQYFSLIEQGKNSDNDELTKSLKSQLDDIELEFSNDPVYIALMKSERATELHE